MAACRGLNALQAFRTMGCMGFAEAGRERRLSKNAASPFWVFLRSLAVPLT